MIIKTESKINLALIAALICVLVGIHTAMPDFYQKLFYLSTQGDVDKIIDFFRSFGVWAILISFIVDVIVNSLGFLPSIFISTANGILFGLPLGILISWTAESVGVIISFFVMRFLLRDTALLIISKSKRLHDLDTLSSKNGFQFMVAARTMPYFPSGILTALGAVSGISTRDYILATFIGKFPSTALEVVVGHDVVNYQDNLNRLTFIIIIVIAIYLFIWYKKQRKNKNSG